MPFSIDWHVVRCLITGSHVIHSKMRIASLWDNTNTVHTILKGLNLQVFSGLEGVPSVSGLLEPFSGFLLSVSRLPTLFMYEARWFPPYCMPPISHQASGLWTWLYTCGAGYKDARPGVQGTCIAIDCVAGWWDYWLGNRREPTEW